MRVDLPLCSFNYCRHYFDGNCIAKDGKREGCEFKALEDILYTPDGTERVTINRLRGVAEAEASGTDALEAAHNELRQVREQLAAEQVTSQSLRNAANGYKAQLTAEKRRADAAVEDMKVMALAMRESDELSEGCCFACAHDGQNLPDDAILIYGECPGYEADDCFEWRGAKEEME